ncbi:MAG TPA: hypothetical protein PK668_04555 [Myxococcota bacterium]|nr:hypothetical protein [Myxococcota bacterium]HRY92131.1 hypothetical protein [Myxococcota bacterium]HSA21728.1 hypothetical protein [Myxococcota bacterium]
MRTWLGVVALGALTAWAGPARAEGQVLKDGDNFVWTAELLAGAARGEGKLALTLVPRGKWKITLEAPLKVGLAPPAGLSVAKTLLKKDDLLVKTKERARFEVGYQVTSPGKHPLKLSFDFVLCDDKICQKKKFDVEYPIPGP